MYRFYRVPFGIISSPFLLAATIDHHLKNCNNDVSETIRKNIYVDNVITGTQLCQKAVHLYNVSKQVLVLRWFEMRCSVIYRYACYILIQNR